MNARQAFKPSRIILILAVCLFCSVLLNVIQFSAAQVQPDTSSRPVGTYCTNNGPPGDGVYLVLDREGRYCQYVQFGEIFERGTYAEDGQGQYALSSDEGEHTSVLIVDDTAYLFSGGGLTAYPKMSDVPTFINVEHSDLWQH